MKALAAFGAPTIRYQKFSHASGRSVAPGQPRRDGSANQPAPPNPEPEPTLIRQTEPIAAPEQTASLLPSVSPLAAVPPAPLQVGETPPARQATQASVPAAPMWVASPPPVAGYPSTGNARPVPATTPTATVAPPPRPLAEWAAPVAPPVPPPRPVAQVPPVAAPVSAPVSAQASTAVSAQASAPMNAPVNAPAVAIPAAPAPAPKPAMRPATPPRMPPLAPMPAPSLAPGGFADAERPAGAPMFTRSAAASHSRNDWPLAELFSMLSAHPAGG